MIQPVGFKQLDTFKPRRYRELVFISDYALKPSVTENRQLQINPNNYFLNRAEISDWLTIKQIYGPRNIIKQLRDLQFPTNSAAKLSSKTDHDSIIVKLNQTLISLSREIAQRIIVASKEKK
ncbi:MAG: FeoA domain-containing protein [Cyanobacteria bacterium P01_C01_bin.72]